MNVNGIAKCQMPLSVLSVSSGRENHSSYPKEPLFLSAPLSLPRYVHAIAHQFGGMFHTPHGEANSMVLPLVLDFYIRDEGGANDDEPGPLMLKYVELAKAAGLVSHYDTKLGGKRQVALARAFVAKVRSMNAEMSIKSCVKAMGAADVGTVARRALDEAHGARVLDLGYPVPKYMTMEECEGLVAALLPAQEQDAWRRNTPGGTARL